MNTITFSNNQTFPTMNVLFYTEACKGATRNHLEIIFNGDDVSYEQAEQIFDDPDNFKRITIINAYDEENVSEFKYLDYDIPVNITKTKANGYTTVHLKVAQKTVTEIQQDQLIAENEAIQMAILEIAAGLPDADIAEDATEITDEVVETEATTDQEVSE